MCSNQKQKVKMCKSYKQTSTKTDYEKKISVLAPVNPKMIISPEDVPQDELSWSELNMRINSGIEKPVKDCPVCCKEFKSEHAYQIHIRKHRPVCPHCDLKLKSWSEYSEHIPYCSRKYYVRTLPRNNRETQKKPVLKFKCQLCRRRYANEKQLRSHQINRCEKRYLQNGWVVKI